MRVLAMPKLVSCMSAALCALLLAITAQVRAAPVQVKHARGDFVVVNGAKLWYESEGKGEPLLLIAGGPGSAHYFEPYFSSLAESHRLIYFDAFGRGKSARAASPKEYTFERDVEDVEGLRRALGLEQINLLGHSYGGMVAQAYALKYPGAVKRLILANAPFSGEAVQAINNSCHYELRNQYPEVWANVEDLRAQGFRSSSKEHQQAYQLPIGLLYFYDASRADEVPLDFNTDVYYAIGGDDADFLVGGDIAALDFRTRLKELKMPTLIIAGRYDRLSLPIYSLQFKRFAPQAHFVMFEKSGHVPFMEENAKLMETLRDFLRR